MILDPRRGRALSLALPKHEMIGPIRTMAQRLNVFMCMCGMPCCGCMQHAIHMEGAGQATTLCSAGRS